VWNHGRRNRGSAFLPQISNYPSVHGSWCSRVFWSVHRCCDSSPSAFSEKSPDWPWEFLYLCVWPPQKILLDCTIFGAHNPGRHRALHTSSHLAFISNKDEARSTGAGGSMIRYMVWVVFEICEGWGCSRCDWVIPLPRLDNTVAALQYNRTAQQSFDVHECHHNGGAGSVRVNIHSEDLAPYRT